MVKMMQKGCKELFLQLIVIKGMNKPMNRIVAGESAHKSVQSQCKIAAGSVHMEKGITCFVFLDPRVASPFEDGDVVEF